MGGKGCIQSALLNDHTAMNMYYVWTATLLRGFKSNLERERKWVKKKDRNLLFGSRKKKVSQ